MLGYNRERSLVNLGDTADLYAYLTSPDEEAVDPATIQSILFTIQKPDGTKSTTNGSKKPDGAGFLLYTTTTTQGQYRVVATFTMTDGRKISVKSDFQVVDPFLTTEPADWSILTDTQRHTAMEDVVASHVWDRFEDLFDSTDGGPWMRDMTMNIFGPHKIPDFINGAVFDINVYNPPTEFALDKFAMPINGQPNPNLTLIVQGTMIAVIRHLMRTYAEQPLPTGGQITYEDRRDYLQRWGTIYQIEFQHYDHLVKLWKRQFLGLGTSKVLVGNKAGRLLPAPLRSRNIGRGYYALSSPLLLLLLEQLGHKLGCW